MLLNSVLHVWAAEWIIKELGHLVCQIQIVICSLSLSSKYSIVFREASSCRGCPGRPEFHFSFRGKGVNVRKFTLQDWW
jgi:hypothetical protein